MHLDWTPLALSTLTLFLVGCGGHSSSSRHATSAGVSSSDPSSVSTAAIETGLRLAQPRAEHTATLLGNGEVLVVGGLDRNGSPLSATERVTPARAQPGPRLAIARLGHSATRLASGKVVVAGGAARPDEVLASTEVFDPQVGAFVAGPALNTPRANHVAVALGEQLLVVGGYTFVDGQRVQLADAELIDLAQGEATVLPHGIGIPQERLQVARLPEGRVLLAGGTSQVAAAPALIFCPERAHFTAIPGTPQRAGMALSSLRGKPVLVGGIDLAGSGTNVDVYDDAELGAPTSLATDLTTRRDAAAVALPNAVLVVGGRNEGAPRDEVELLRPGRNGVDVTPLTPLSEARVRHTATASGSGKVLIVGGYGASGRPIGSIEVFDPASVGVAGAPREDANGPTHASPLRIEATKLTVNTSAPAGAISLDVNALATLLLAAAGQVPTSLPASVGQGPKVTLSQAALTSLLQAIASNRTSAATFSPAASGGSAAPAPNLAGLNALLAGLAPTGNQANQTQALNALANALSGLTRSANASSSSNTNSSGSGALGLINRLLGSLGGLLGGNQASSNSGGGGIGGLLNSLLGGLTGSGGSSSGAGGALGNLVSGLFGGSTNNASSSGGGLLGNLFGGSANNASSSSGSLGSLFGGSTNNGTSSGGLLGNLFGGGGGGGGFSFGFGGP